MWEKIKKRLYLVILILLIGIWFGYNIGQGRPFWTNPFVPGIQQKIKNKASEMVKDTKKVLRDSLAEDPR